MIYKTTKLGLTLYDEQEKFGDFYNGIAGKSTTDANKSNMEIIDEFAVEIKEDIRTLMGTISDLNNSLQMALDGEDYA